MAPPLEQLQVRLGLWKGFNVITLGQSHIFYTDVNIQQILYMLWAFLPLVSQTEHVISELAGSFMMSSYVSMSGLKK